MDETIGVRAGYFPIGVGLVNFRHHPMEHLGVTRFEAEIAMLPGEWSEAGVGLFGKLPVAPVGELAWRVEAVTGLHLLPFHPYSSDDGFSVIDYDAVDPELVQPLGHQAPIRMVAEE